MSTATSWIEKHPDVCGGDACIRNTRITVWGLVEYRNLGLTDEQIRRQISGLTAADLEAAWDYYRHHTQEIDQALWENQAAMIESATGAVPAAFLREGRRFGLTDEQIRNAFEPPLPQASLDRVP